MDSLTTEVTTQNNQKLIPELIQENNQVETTKNYQRAKNNTKKVK